MKFKIREFKAPHALVEYWTDDGKHKAYLNVRIDKKPDGTLPAGRDLDAYLLSYAPQLPPPPDPFEGVDWSGILALVEKDPTISQALDVPSCVSKFMADKGIEGPATYSYSVFNTELSKDVGHVYGTMNHLIKTNPDRTIVTEYYEANVVVEGTRYLWVSRNVATDGVMDKYTKILNGVEKIPAGDQGPVRTFFGGYDSIDPRLQPVLSAFQNKNRIMAWSQKSSGLVVEYRKS